MAVTKRKVVDLQREIEQMRLKQEYLMRTVDEYESVLNYDVLQLHPDVLKTIRSSFHDNFLASLSNSVPAFIKRDQDLVLTSNEVFALRVRQCYES